MDNNQRYVVKKVLGSGAFGYVFLALDSQKNKYALKRIKKVGNQLSREFEILQEIRGLPHCIQMIECFYTQTNKGEFIQNLIFEYLENDLLKVIKKHSLKKQQIDILQIKKIAYDIFEGLSILHSKNIIHRDLKPENVLMSEKGEVKICDFGSAKFLDRNGKNNPYVVSRYYRAPELFLSMIDYDDKIDVWSAGCILGELVTLEPLFIGKTEGGQFIEILKILGSLASKDSKFFVSKNVHISEVLKKVSNFKRDEKTIKKWTSKLKKIEDRKNLNDLFNKIFVYNPHDRLSAAEVIKHEFFRDVRNKGVSLKFPRI